MLTLVHSADASPQSDAIESLCAPRHPIGYAGYLRPHPNDWIDDLRAHGVRLGDIVTFTSEVILQRFRLLVQPDGIYRCEPDEIMPTDHIYVPASIQIITDQGHTADSLAELIAHVTDDSPSWLYPLDYQCRISHMREPQAYVLALIHGLARFAPATGETP